MRTDAPGRPTPSSGKSPFNAYRFNGKRWDAGSATYDMGFRDYAPGLNTFTTRDMYNGALADLGLGSDPYTGSRYAFAAGNPISRIELDGHMYADEGPRAVAVEPPTVTNGDLQNIINDTYAKPGSVPYVGTGKAGEALINELDTGDKTKGKYHILDVAELFNRYSEILEDDRKARVAGNALLTEAEVRIATAEATEIWDALNHEASADNAAIKDIKDSPGRIAALKGTMKKATARSAVKGITGNTFIDVPYKGPRLSGASKLPKIMGALGVVGDAFMMADGAMLSGEIATGSPRASRACGDFWGIEGFFQRIGICSSPPPVA
ncbi:RHS repeat-associated core domain-containing protein [Nocardioides sp. NPDC000445]|uniref:RHS repeat-associated core domain-containing protein n=1 Tax=Nocardioides sp. NPDC000445 TaxID=3154257 RepID=UPI00331FDC7C